MFRTATSRRLWQGCTSGRKPNGIQGKGHVSPVDAAPHRKAGGAARTDGTVPGQVNARAIRYLHLGRLVAVDRERCLTLAWFLPDHHSRPRYPPGLDHLA